MVKSLLIAALAVVVPGLSWATIAGIADNPKVGISSNGATVGVLNGRLLVNADPASLVTSYFACSTHDGVNAASASSDNPILLLVNLSTNTVTALLTFRSMNTDVTNVEQTFNMYIDSPVISSGTSISVVKLFPNSPNSQLLCFKLPTIASEGPLVDTIPVGQNSSALIISDEAHISIAPGHNLLITANPSSNNRKVFISTKWLEQ